MLVDLLCKSGQLKFLDKLETIIDEKFIYKFLTPDNEIIYTNTSDFNYLYKNILKCCTEISEIPSDYNILFTEEFDLSNSNKNSTSLISFDYEIAQTKKNYDSIYFYFSELK